VDESIRAAATWRRRGSRSSARLRRRPGSRAGRPSGWRDREVGLAGAGQTEEADVGLLLDPAELRQVQQQWLRGRRLCGPVEVVLQHRQERIKLRAARQPPTARRVLVSKQSRDRPTVDPDPPARSPATRARPPPTSSPAPTPTRPAPPDLLTSTDPDRPSLQAKPVRPAPRRVMHSSLSDAGAVSDAARHRLVGPSRRRNRGSPDLCLSMAVQDLSTGPARTFRQAVSACGQRSVR
jgi:hypothetical protein